MLLGCCHCNEEPPSSSTSGSGSGSASVEPVGCGPCIVVPKRWLITISGWTGLTTPHDSCCSSINGDHVISLYTKPPFSTSCVVYRSEELARDQRTVPTPCTEIGVRRLILAQLDNNFPTPTSSLTVGVSVATSGTSPITYQNEIYSITFSSAVSCITGGTLNYVTEGGTGPLRCSPSATLTAVPI